MDSFLALPVVCVVWIWSWLLYLVCRTLWMLLGHLVFTGLDHYCWPEKYANANQEGRVFDFGFGITIRILKARGVQQYAIPSTHIPKGDSSRPSSMPPSSPELPAVVGSREAHSTARAPLTQAQASRRRAFLTVPCNPNVPRNTRGDNRAVATSISRRRIPPSSSLVPSRTNSYITVVPKHRRLQPTTLRSGLPLLFDPRPTGTDDIALLTPNRPREIRAKILLLQITVTAYKRAETVIDGLHELLLDLTPITSLKNPKPDFHAIAWACVEDGAKLGQVVRATGKLLYKREADRVYLQGWWHDEVYPARLLEKDIVEFEGWVQVCMATARNKATKLYERVVEVENEVHMLRVQTRAVLPRTVEQRKRECKEAMDRERAGEVNVRYTKDGRIFCDGELQTD
ncbi:hypothetical protein BU16DRAFT_566945 [Lophium mytilinum]|uniref:Uncharacterized protein n=1 Tax=Lophium mytilinum TaxID=390894 RepID=A0A6A6QEE1_9PEZI|nr:hypothetical protein BU16DRAFT_566945 [Lophium mytilinum]